MRALRYGLALLAGLVNRAAVLICHVCVAVMTMSILLQVFRRYVMNASLLWPEELSLFLMAWLVFVGASVALRRGEHVAVQVLVDRLGPRSTSVVQVLMMALILFLTAIFTVTSWRVAVVNRKLTSDALQISLFWPKLGLPVGGLFLSIQALHLLVERLTGLLGGERE